MQEEGFFSANLWWYSGVLLVSDVAGVVDPHKLAETLTPSGGQMQPHVEGVLSLRSLVPPAEPISLKLGRFLQRDDNAYKPIQDLKTHLEHSSSSLFVQYISAKRQFKVFNRQ